MNIKLSDIVWLIFLKKWKCCPDLLLLKFFFIFGSIVFYGAVAQLGERLHGMQEVDGSIPFSSTIPELLPPNCPKSVMGRVVWAVRMYLKVAMKKLCGCADP